MNVRTLKLIEHFDEEDNWNIKERFIWNIHYMDYWEIFLMEFLKIVSQVSPFRQNVIWDVENDNN